MAIAEKVLLVDDGGNEELLDVSTMIEDNQPLPQVIVRHGKHGGSLASFRPSKVFSLDELEMKKRNFSVVVYSQKNALFI